MSKPSSEALRQAARFWSCRDEEYRHAMVSEGRGPIQLLGTEWLSTGWVIDDEWNADWQEEADLAASAALSDAEAPRGMR